MRFLDFGALFHGFFEATDGLAQALPQLWKALGPEDQKSNQKNDHKLLRTDAKHGETSFLHKYKKGGLRKERLLPE
jgi:hypothetical protein